jgi:nucleotide-binding universal stress UspA family protein
MTVGPKAASTPGTAGLKRILFATDLSKQSVAALAFLPMLVAESPSAAVTIAHFTPPARGSLPQRYRVRRALESSVIKLVPETLRKRIADVVVEACAPAEGTVEFAKDHGAGLILLGVRAGGPFTRAATHGRPSITHQIIRAAPCPVITVRS